MLHRSEIETTSMAVPPLTHAWRGLLPPRSRRSANHPPGAVPGEGGVRVPGE
jgi:hypothetical protein